MATKTAPPEPTVSIVVCVEGFYCERPDTRVPLVAATGDRFNSDDPVVRAAPERFIPFGSPDREIAIRRGELREVKARKNEADHARAVEREQKRSLADRALDWFADRDRTNHQPADRDYVRRQAAPRWPGLGDDAA